MVGQCFCEVLVSMVQPWQSHFCFSVFWPKLWRSFPCFLIMTVSLSLSVCELVAIPSAHRRFKTSPAWLESKVRLEEKNLHMSLQGRHSHIIFTLFLHCVIPQPHRRAFHANFLSSLLYEWFLQWFWSWSLLLPDSMQCSPMFSKFSFAHRWHSVIKFFFFFYRSSVK